MCVVESGLTKLVSVALVGELIRGVVEPPGARSGSIVIFAQSAL